MNTIELFSGLGSFSTVAERRGHGVFRVEINSDDFQQEMCEDILNVKASDLFQADIIWASPPCTSFSVASIGRNWVKGFPKTSKTAINMAYVLKTIELIKELKPTYWFIENPRAMLRKMPFMQDFKRETVTYCQYGEKRMKPTDIWHNLEGWKPKPICKNGDSCHVAAPRGSQTGTQGMGSAAEKAIIPSALIEEIFDTIEGEK